MGRLISTLTEIADSPLSTGDPVGDATSYAAFVAVLGAAWRLFKWYRDDRKELDLSHDATMARMQRNNHRLLVHITSLSIELARLGGDVPATPELEEV